MTWLRKYFPYLVIAPVVIPVIISGGLFYPYLVDKTFTFYALVLLALATLALVLANGYELHTGRLKHWMTWIPGALLVLAYIASLAGLNFYRSFWSIFARGDGLLMLTVSVASFYLIVLTEDQHFLKRLLSTVAWVGSAVAAYGIIEWLITGGRLDSTIGNAALVAGYLALALFSTLAATSFYQGSWRTALYWAAGLEVLAIILTATRGTILALGITLIIACVYAVMREKGSVRTWSLGILVAIVVVGGGGLLFRSELAKVPFAPIARVAQISTSDPDVASRLFLWRNMTQAVLEHPLLGVGAEHIDYLFNQFYDPSKLAEEWFDRSHNAFLDYAAQYGILGLVLYIALIASLVILAVRSRTRAGFFLALGGVAYAVHNFFVFDSISSWWLFLALFGALCLNLEGKSIRYRLPAVASYPLAAIFVALIIPVSILPLIANYDIAQAYLYHLVDVNKTNTYLQSGLTLGTYADLEYGYEVDDMYVNGQVTTLKGADLVSAYNETTSILQNNLARYPYDARTGLYLLDVESLAPPGASPPSENDMIALAQKVIKLSPKRSAPWYILVNLALSQANTYPVGSANRADGYKTAFQLLTQYVATVPKLSQPHYVLAQLYQALGDSKDSTSEAALGKQYYTPDLPTAKRAASYYEGLQDWSDALFFLKSIVALDPTDYASLYNEAKVEFLTGNPAAADAIVMQLRTKDPAIIATDPAFVSAITQYENAGH